MIGNIKGIIDKVASRKLGVTAVAGGRRGHRGGGDCLADGGGYGRGRDHPAGGYCGRGVYHWSGYGGCVWRLRRGRGERKAGRL